MLLYGLMGSIGYKRAKHNLGQPETWNLSFAATLDERGRISLKKEILDTAKLQDGDIIFLTLTGVNRKEAKK